MYNERRNDMAKDKKLVEAITSTRKKSVGDTERKTGTAFRKKTEGGAGGPGVQKPLVYPSVSGT